MAICIFIREFTENDKNALNESAKRFACRQGIKLQGPSYDLEPYDYLEMSISHESWYGARVKLLRKAWQACKCRALKVSVSARVTVAHGYIGYRIS
jgi:hypothetical protein